LVLWICEWQRGILGEAGVSGKAEREGWNERRKGKLGLEGGKERREWKAGRESRKGREK
jgi:hypothetical protein